MPNFKYAAVKRNGEPVSGVIEGASRTDVMDQLLNSGILPSLVEPVKPNAGRGQLFRNGGKKRAKKSDVELLMRELSRLLRAGVSLDQALETIAATTEGSGLGSAASQLTQDVRSGQSLSEAMASYGDPFDRVTVTLVEAAEMAGAMTTVFDRTAESLKRAKKLKDAVTTALVYPAMLLLVSVAAILMMLITVVPEFESMLTDTEGEIPGLTTMIFSVSAFLRGHGLLLLAGTAGGLLGLSFAARQPAFRAGAMEVANRIPIVGALLQKAAAARLCRGLGVLVMNGIQLLAALRTLAGSAPSPREERMIRGAAETLEGGASFGEAVEQHQLLPVLATRMVGIGEKSGQLGPMLIDVAEIYEDDVQDGFKRLVTLLEPLLILFLGFIVGGVIISILTAIMTVNDIVGV